MGDWGYLLTQNVKPLRNGMFQGLHLCISTEKVDTIDETLKVMAEGKGFWIKMKEFNPSHSMQEDTSANRNKTISEASLNTSDQEEDCSLKDNVFDEDNVDMGDNLYENILDLSQEDHQKDQYTELKDAGGGHERVEEGSIDKEHLEGSQGTNVGQSENSHITVNLCDSTPPEAGATDSVKGIAEIWKMRENQSSTDNSQTSLGLYEPIIDQLYNEVTMDSPKELTPVNQVDSEMSKLIIGKKLGRPRKALKRFSFLEMKGGKRRKIIKSHPKKVQGKERQEDSAQFPALNNQKDLATDILETGMLMGIIPLKNKEEALKDIRQRLTENKAK